MTDRTTLVVPAEQIGSLGVPPLALDDASSDVGWVKAPLGGFWGSERIPVPLAARSLWNSSRFLLEFRWRSLIGWLVFAAYVVVAHGYMQGLWGFVPQVVLAGLSGGWLVWASRRPRQLPYRSHLGEMGIPQVSRGRTRG
ncbi:MAG TPA: hypothetical protein VN408_08080 [Actinoplanes sp.]|nr:hypothetical protein [Actinoplanes sp.]